MLNPTFYYNSTLQLVFSIVLPSPLVTHSFSARSLVSWLKCSYLLLLSLSAPVSYWEFNFFLSIIRASSYLSERTCYICFKFFVHSTLSEFISLNFFLFQTFYYFILELNELISELLTIHYYKKYFHNFIFTNSLISLFIFILFE